MVAPSDLARAERRVDLLMLEADDPESVDRVDLAAADEWFVVLLVEGTPVGTVRLPGPGLGAGRGLARAALLRHADEARERWRLERSLRGRMGLPEPRRGSLPTVSVVVCTHGRPASLARLLDALQALDPPPHEVVIVDNAPDVGQDCLDLAEANGFVYVREDRKGLNHARSAGWRAARSDLVAFTDDDCAPPVDWLSAVPELFDDATVAAVTGPAFPVELDETKLRFELSASFGRGFRRRRFDWTVLSPVLAGRVGAGANMIFRRTVLDELGDPFPGELDVGTPTQSGGDTYAFYRLLAAGKRVVYDPGTYTFHDHREDPEALRKAIHGYGVGLGSVATKLLLEERELGAPRVVGWTLRAYVRERLRALVGAGDPDRLEAARHYLRGAIQGPRAWRAALAAAPPPARERRRAGLDAPAPRGRPPRRERGVPRLSVVVTTHRRPDALAECLRALAAQDSDAPPFEVIVVDDTPRSERRPVPQPSDLSLRVIATDGSGAAAARNAGARDSRGDLVLFLDDDLLADPGLVRRHAEAHRDGVDVVIGYSPPRPVRRNLISTASAWWWEDHYRAKRDAAALTFREMLSGNMSASRQALANIGLFDEGFGAFRREDWEWGIRALRRGARVVYEPDAVAFHRFELTPRGRLAAAEREGRGDALLLESYPFVLPSVPAGSQTPPGGLRRRLLFRLLLRPGARRVAVSTLDLVERARARGNWASWFDLVQRAAYEDGFRRAGGRKLSRAAAQPAPVELDSRNPLPSPGPVNPGVELRLQGRHVGFIPSGEGQWSRDVAFHMAAGVPRADLSNLANGGGPNGAGSPERGELLLAPGSNADSPASKLPQLDWWSAFDRAVRDSSRDVVALALPGTSISEIWLPEVAQGLEGARVAMVLSAGLPPRRAPEPLRLMDGRTPGASWQEIGTPPQALALGREACLALGGLDPTLGSLGTLAPVLDLIRRALERGYAVAQWDSHAIAPVGTARPFRSRLEWRRWQALGGISGREAASGRLASPLLTPARRVASGLRRGRLRQAAGVSGAFALGLARGALDAARRPG